jgi:RimJ/RimL family protein N-acetyltransferase
MLRRPRLIELRTDDRELSLRELTVADADEYYALVDRNREHLTQFGNYQDEGVATLEWVNASLSRAAAGLRFGIWHHGILVGRAELVPKLPGHYGLGYWLGREHVGRGFMTTTVSRLLRHARETLEAVAFFAGVTHGNAKSVAVLHRLGFVAAVTRADHTVFALAP